MVRRTAIMAGLVAAGAGLSGCGTSRIAVPPLARPAAPRAFHSVTFGAAGVRLSIPGTWTLQSLGPGAGTGLIATISSGTAVISLWRFARSSPLPSGTAGLVAARDGLLRAARARQPSLRLIRATVGHVQGADRVELDTLQRMDGRVRRVRSFHVFLPGAELVLEEYAPPTLFPSVDHTVFSPVRHSLRLLAVSSA